jgi:magnesium transporter
LSFAEQTAGRLAELEVPTAREDQSVADALKRSHKRGPDLPYLYVTDRHQMLVGVVSRRELRRAKPEATVADIMLRDVRCILAFTPWTGLAAHPAWRHHDALPVVDGSGVLIGFLRHKVLRREIAALSSPDLRSAAEGGLIALGSAYCELLARAMVALTTTPTLAQADSAIGGEA